MTHSAKDDPVLRDVFRSRWHDGKPLSALGRLDGKPKAGTNDDSSIGRRLGATHDAFDDRPDGPANTAK